MHYMPDPFISVVVPTYNRAGYIARTLASLLTQDYDAYEIIVVDDGSTDNTEEVVAGIKDDRIRYHKKDNAERGAARNYGARMAKGRYVTFFDSDDLAHNNHIQEAARAIEKFRQPEIFYLGYDVRDADGRIQWAIDALPSPVNDRLIDGNHLSCNCVFVRKDVFLELPFSENRALSGSEDYSLWLRMASRYEFRGVSVVTSTLVNHDDRSVVNIKRDTFLARMEALRADLLSDPIFQKRFGKEWNTFRAYQDIYMALHLGMAKFPKGECLAYLWSSFRHRPQVIFSYRFLAALKNILV